MFIMPLVFNGFIFFFYTDINPLKTKDIMDTIDHIFFFFFTNVSKWTDSEEVL